MVSGWWLGVLLAVATPALAAQRPAAPDAGVATSLPTPQFRRYGVADGLPSGAIYAVAQDRNGVMWFGAAGGLVRFDGVSFKVFRHAADDPQSLPSNQTYALFVDRDNRIWAGGVSTGLAVFDQGSGRFRHWEHVDGQRASLAANEVWSIAQTPDGVLWVATQGGLDRMRADGSGFDQLALDIDGQHAASIGPTRALMVDAGGQLWIGAASGLYRRSAEGVLRRVPVDPAFQGDIGTVWHIEGGDGDGEVRVAVTGGLLRVGADGVARPIANRQLAAQRIMSSARDRQGRLWMGTLSGVILDQGDGSLRHIAGQPLLPGGLPSDRLWQVLRDREGGLWFTFDQSSVAYLAPNWNRFARFTHVPDDPESLSDIAALSLLFGKDGKLWVGGFNGWVDKLDVATGEVSHVVKGLHGNLASLAEDARGRLWITGPGRLYRHDRSGLMTLGADQTGLKRPVLGRRRRRRAHLRGVLG